MHTCAACAELLALAGSMCHIKLDRLLTSKPRLTQSVFPLHTHTQKFDLQWVNFKEMQCTYP